MGLSLHSCACSDNCTKYPQASGLRYIWSHIHTMHAEPEENAGTQLGSRGITYNCQPSSSLVPILLIGMKCVKYHTVRDCKDKVL